MNKLKKIWENSNLSNEDIKQICNGDAESQLRMRLYRDVNKQGVMPTGKSELTRKQIRRDFTN